MLEEKKRDFEEKGPKKKQKKETKKKGVKIFSFFFIFGGGRKEMFLRLKKEGKERERFDFELRYPLELLLPQSDFQGENFSSTVPARKN